MEHFSLFRRVPHKLRRRGYSIRSIERFCQEKGIHKTCRLSEEDVEEAVIEAVSKVCTLMLNYWACPYHTGYVEDLCHTSYAKLKLVAYFFKLLGQEVISFWGRIWLVRTPNVICNTNKFHCSIDYLDYVLGIGNSKSSQYKFHGQSLLYIIFSLQAWILVHT